MATIKRLTGGRVWVARLSLLAAVGVIVGLMFAVVPVFASPGDDISPASGQGILPEEVDLGGQNNDCAAVELGNLYDYRIADPATGSYTDSQSGFDVTFNLTARRVGGEDFLDYEVVGPGLVHAVVIKGGSNSALYDYLDPKYIDTVAPVGVPVSSDTGTHATLKNNERLFGVSHSSFCYEIAVQASGTVFVDENVNSALDTGEPADTVVVGSDPPRGLRVSAYDFVDGDGDALASFTESSTTDGSYSFALSPGVYTLCLEAREGFEQTIPDLDLNPGFVGGVDCSKLGSTGQHELVGYRVDLTVGSSDGKDFGNFAVFPCVGEDVVGNLLLEGIEGSFAIFSNSQVECGNKAGETIFNGEGAEPVVGIVLDGSGQAVGRAVIKRKALTPLAASINPLEYSPTGVGFDDLPWCNYRAFTVNDPVTGLDDGPQFIDDIGTAWYPTLDNLDDQFGGDPINCKVTEGQDLFGDIVTVVFFNAVDPFYR